MDDNNWDEEPTPRAEIKTQNGTTAASNDDNDAFDNAETIKVRFEKSSFEPRKPVVQNKISWPRDRDNQSPPRRSRPPERAENKNIYSNRSFGNRRLPSQYRSRDMENSPPKNFKDFVSIQDDRITPEEAIKKFEQYKLEIKQQKLKLTYEQHRADDWFIVAYHPYYRTIDQISRIRDCRKRLTYYIKFITLFNTWSTSHSDTKLSFDITSENLQAYIQIICRVLENEKVEDLQKVLDSILSIKSDKSTEKDLIKVDRSRKRRYDDDSESNSENESDDEQTTFSTNTGVEIKNIPFNISKRRILKKLKSIHGFIRMSNYIVKSIDYKCYKLISTFGKDVSFNTVKDTLADCIFDEYNPEVVKYKDTSPILRSVRGYWNVNGVVAKCMHIAVSLIEALDKSMYLYSEKFPMLPTFDKSFKNVDLSSEEIAPKDSESESESEPESQTDEPGPNMVENPVLEDARRVLSNCDNLDDTAICDPRFLEMLDTLILYLRVVHSFDFYSFTWFENENRMPCRCQIVYARKITESKNISKTKVAHIVSYLNDKYCRFLEYLNRYEGLETKEVFSDLKDENVELEKFMESRLNEVRPNVWQCQICKKKFQTQEFVKKHLTSKHAQIIDAVKLNVFYYNNFLVDSNFLCEKDTGKKLDLEVDEVGNSLSNSNISQTKRQKTLVKYNEDGELDFDSFNL